MLHKLFIEKIQWWKNEKCQLDELVQNMSLPIIRTYYTHNNQTHFVRKYTVLNWVNSIFLARLTLYICIKYWIGPKIWIGPIQNSVFSYKLGLVIMRVIVCKTNYYTKTIPKKIEILYNTLLQLSVLLFSIKFVKKNYKLNRNYMCYMVLFAR